MNYGTKATDLRQIYSRSVVKVAILALYGFAAALMMSIHLAG